MAAGLILFTNTWYGYEHGLFTIEKINQIGPSILFYMSPFLLEFLAGVLLAHYIQCKKIQYPMILIVFGMTMIFFGGLYNHLHPDSLLGAAFNNHYRVALFGTAAVSLVSGMLGLEQQGRKLVTPFSLLFGGASYALYLLHPIVYRILTITGAFKSIKALLSGIPYGVEIALFSIVVLIVMVSVLIHRHIELPIYMAAKRVNPFENRH